MCVCFIGHLLTALTTSGNNSSVNGVLLPACYHDDNMFKYRAYTFTYLLLFPVAFLGNIGALVVFLMQSSRR